MEGRGARREGQIPLESEMLMRLLSRLLRYTGTITPYCNPDAHLLPAAGVRRAGGTGRVRRRLGIIVDPGEVIFGAGEEGARWVKGGKEGALRVRSLGCGRLR